MEKLFSVIVLHYNQPDYWKEALSSVLCQDYSRIQLIFADDGSDDLNIEAVKQFINANAGSNIEEIIYIYDVPNLGTCGNCNRALSYVKGEYCAFLDGDDAYYDNHAISSFVEEFSEISSKQYIVTGNCAFYGETLDHIKYVHLTDEIVKEANAMSVKEQHINIYLYNRFFPTPSATAYRIQCFKKFGKFDTKRFRICQDGYFFLHVTRYAAGRIYYTNKLIAKHRGGGVCSIAAEAKVSPTQIQLKKEFVRMVEYEILAYFWQVPDEFKEAVLNKFSQNLWAYEEAVKEEYSLCFPARYYFNKYIKRYPEKRYLLSKKEE